MFTKHLVALFLGVSLLFATQKIIAQASAPELFELFQNASPSIIPDSKILFLCRNGQDSELNQKSRLFLSEEWSTGLVLDYGGDFYKIKAKYRIFDDEMVIMLEDDICVLQRPTVRAIQFNDQIYLSLPYINDRQEEDRGYFSLLSDGRIRLVQKKTLKRNLIKECLFVQIDDDPAVKFKGGRKTMLKLMSDQRIRMESFLDSKQFNWNNIEDLKEILDYYHRLRTEG